MPGADEWMAHMRRGDFAAAWALGDAGLAARRSAGTPPRWDLPRHLQHVWDGSALEGRRVLVRCYHGLGDTIQFIRYATPLRAIAREVIVWSQPALLPLLRTVHGVDRALELHDGAPDVAFDVDVEIMELAHVCRSELHTLPAVVPYVHVEPAQSRAIAATHAAGRRAVGIVWRAGEWDGRRSIPAALVQEILGAVPGVDWYILQRGVDSPEAAIALGIDAGSDDPFAAAQTMRALDLVITVDSFPAHLAGALGVPVWTLLHSEPDWRWMDAPRENSPWYPTMRLFRQDSGRPGDWRPVLERLAVELS